MTDYSETKDLPSYISGYEQYCDEIERSNKRNHSNEFTEYDDERYEEYRIQEELNGKRNL